MTDGARSEQSSNRTDARYPADLDPLVSIVMPAYNAVAFITRAIESALAQRGVTVEVIIVDDGSSDGTSAFVSGHYDGDARVRVLRLDQNSGPGIARNAAIAAARGAWVAVLDADDALGADHLRTLCTLGKATGADIVAANFAYYDTVTRTLTTPALRTQPAAEILDSSAYVAGARPYTHEADLGLLQPLLRTDFLRTSGVRYPTDVRHGEDMEFILMALLAGAKYVVDRSTCSYFYTTRASGHSRTQIDYRQQARRTRTLKNWPAISTDRMLVALLDRRAAALERLAFDRDWQARDLDRAKLAGRAILSQGGRRWLMQRMASKIVG